MDHDLLVALQALLEPTRLRIVGRLADRPATPAELASDLDVAPAVIRRHLEKLVAAGVVEASGDGAAAPHALRIQGIDELARRLATMDARSADRRDGYDLGPAGEPIDPDVARVLRGYFEDDRLITIPANHGKRMVVLRYLRDRCFGEDRVYPEKEVNQRLALFHPDVAALRRFLVDEGLMDRAAGVYRRPDEAPPDD